MNNRLVCIVDDNDDIREIYRMKFHIEGFETVTAKNGQEALEVMRTAHPAVVLLDVQMPVMDGLEVLNRMKNDPELKHLPVVILSNIDSEDVFQTVGDLGAADYYLVKAMVDPQKVVDVTIEALAGGANANS